MISFVKTMSVTDNTLGWSNLRQRVLTFWDCRRKRSNISSVNGSRKDEVVCLLSMRNAAPITLWASSAGNQLTRFTHKQAIELMHVCVYRRTSQYMNNEFDWDHRRHDHLCFTRHFPDEPGLLLVYFLHFIWIRILDDKWHGFLHARCSSCHQTNSEHWPQPRTIIHC